MDMMKMFDLSGRTALVTGGTRGIGRVMAEGLIAAGAKVAVSSRSEEECIEAAAGMNASSGREDCIGLASNLRDTQSLDRLVAQVSEDLGGPDVLVCNAASNPHFGDLSTITDDAFRLALDANVVANHHLISAIAPIMKVRGGGSIILMSSIGASFASRNIGAYNVSKAALSHLGRNHAVDLGPHGIRVNVVAPGLVRTDFSRALWENSEQLEMHEKSSPLGRIGVAQDFAGITVFLASAASAFLTGQVITVDGGATLGSEF